MVILKANLNQLFILKEGYKVWNEWRNNNPGEKINFSGSDLSRTNLSKTNLNGADLYSADVKRSNLSKTLLRWADLRSAVLLGSNLRGADISHANLKEVQLEKANLAKSIAKSTYFVDLDLSGAIGLDAVNHMGPSIISTSTLARSKGKIPESFLRGCGLSDWEIEAAKLYDPELQNEDITNIEYKMYDLRARQAFQISPLFISYSHSDSKFVDRMEKCLNEKGIRFWRDIHNMKAGRIEKQIDHAISHNGTVLLVLSKNSLNSDWVQHEVRKARELEQNERRDALCPVTLDNSWNGQDNPWPKRIMEQIREYNILDFSGWQDDSKFDVTFRKLIDGLALFYKG